METVSPSAALRSTRAFALTHRQQLGLLLLIHLLVWTWVGVASRSNFDAAGDMVETYVWGQGWQWGYFKHPPLAAWVAGAWFAVFPESQASFSLLAAANSVFGLAGLAVLAREFLPRPWVLLTLALASLAPGVTTLAMRFNCNAILISTWPWALAMAVRLMRRGRPRDAVLCGLACALAVLGKYYSGVLLLSLLASALWLPQWRARLLTGPVALTVATFLVCMAPHVNWLLSQTQGPLQYAHDAAAQDAGQATSAMRALTFALAHCVFPLLAFVALQRALAGAARRRGVVQAISACVRPRNEPVWLLAMLPIVATVLITLLFQVRTASVWGMPLAAGLSLMACSRAREAGAPVSLPGLWRTMAAIWLLTAALAPAWWVARAVRDAPALSEPREELAQALNRVWRAEFGGPLPTVSGTRALAASTAFYAADHPRYWSLWNLTVETPWIDADSVAGRGGVIVCEPADAACRQLAQTWSADSRRLSASKSTHGFQFKEREYVFYLIEPRVTGALD